MIGRSRYPICVILLVALSGCHSLRPGGHDANIAAVRDLTYHGLNALHQGQADQAENLLNQAAEACPEDQRIRQHLATALVEQGRVDEAIDQLQQAIENSPHDPRLYVELGELYLTRGRPGLALEHAMVALKIDRQMSRAWILRGRCEREQGDHHAALASFHRGATFDCVGTEVQFELARTYQLMQRPLQAMTSLEMYSEHFAADQLPMKAVLLHADTLADLNQYRQAADHLAAACRRSDATADVWLALSRTQQLLGDHSSAQLTARSAQHKFPADETIAGLVQQLNTGADSQYAPERTAALPTTGNIR
ncbi:MAG: tetratricopeptide repeat protein [Pirellulaceae bacterium]